MISRCLVFSSQKGEKLDDGTSQISCRISEPVDHSAQTVATQLSHSLIIYIVNEVMLGI